MQDDYRIRIEVEGEEHASGLLDRIGLGAGGETRDLAGELRERRLAVSRDGGEIFVYAGSRREAEQARAVVEEEVREAGLEAATISQVEHWLEDEDRWDDEPPGPDIEEETLARGYAPWEVRVECASHGEARELADRLEGEGYGIERRWKYVIAGAATKEDATELAGRLHGQVEPGGELVWETVPGNPFAVFGGMGTAGPL